MRRNRTRGVAETELAGVEPACEAASIGVSSVSPSHLPHGRRATDVEVRRARAVRHVLLTYHSRRTHVVAYACHRRRRSSASAAGRADPCRKAKRLFTDRPTSNGKAMWSHATHYPGSWRTASATRASSDDLSPESRATRTESSTVQSLDGCPGAGIRLTRTAGAEDPLAARQPGVHNTWRFSAIANDGAMTLWQQHSDYPHRCGMTGPWTERAFSRLSPRWHIA